MGIQLRANTAAPGLINIWKFSKSLNSFNSGIWQCIHLKFFGEVMYQSIQCVTPPPGNPGAFDQRFCGGGGRNLTGAEHLTLGSANSQCKLNSVIYEFYIFFIDESMLSLRICRHSVGKLMTEVLKIYQKLRDPGKPDQKCTQEAGILQFLKICPEVVWGDGSAWNLPIH